MPNLIREIFQDWENETYMLYELLFLSAITHRIWSFGDSFFRVFGNLYG